MSGSRDAGRPEGDRRRAGGWQDAGWAGGQAGTERREDGHTEADRRPQEEKRESGEWESLAKAH